MRSVLGIRSSFAVMALGLLSATGCAGFPGLSPSQTEEATAQFQDPAEAELAMAKLCEAQGNLEEAVEHCYKAIEANPELVDAYHRLAIIEAKQEQFEQSFATFAKALRLSPNSPQLLADLGYALYLDERYEMSEKALRKAIRIQPGLQVAQTHLAMVLESIELQSTDETEQQLASVEVEEVAEEQEPLEEVEVEATVESTPDMVAQVSETEDEAEDAVQTQSDAIHDAAKAITQRAKPLILEDSQVQPARYVLEPEPETSVRYIAAQEEAEEPSHVEPAVFYEEEEESSVEVEAPRKISVQPAAALLPVKEKKPVLRRPCNPLSDLSEAMTLLESRRSQSCDECNCESCEEDPRFEQTEHYDRPVRLNLETGSSRSSDRSTLNILE